MVISIICAVVISHLRVPAEAGCHFRFPSAPLRSLGGAAMIMCHVRGRSKIHLTYCRDGMAAAAEFAQMA
jgi:hypothetical protein